MNIQVAATLNGKLAAVEATPVHGARHHAHAYAASGLAAALADTHTVADLGYVGVDGIDIAAIRKPQGTDLHQTQAEFNTQLSTIRFPARKSLEEFDFDHARGLHRDVLAHLGTLDFVTGRENVIFLGPTVIHGT